MKKKITFIVGIVVLLAIIGGITFSAYRFLKLIEQPKRQLHGIVRLRMQKSQMISI